MRWKVVEMIIKFFYIFSMIPFAVMQAKQAFFQNWVVTIPQGNGETKVLKDI